MTVSSETRTAGPFTGNGVTTDLPFSFRVFDDTDVIVVQTDLDGVESTLTLTTDYTVTLNADQGDNPGGTVVLNSPLVTGYLATLTSQVHNTQLAELTNVGGFYPAVINAALDKLTVLVQQAVNLTSRSVKIPLSDGTSGVTELPTRSIRAHKALVFDANGNIAASVDNYDDQAANAAASAAAAAASEAAATTQADIVITQASNAAASAAAAAATLNSALWRDVVFLTSADSPVTLNSASNGKLYRCDTSSGAVVFTLPQISSVTAPYNVSIKKETADGNAVTINRSGTDTIDGATSKTLTTAGGGTTLLADVDPAPDQWTAADFGQTAGNMTSDLFSGTGSQTAFTLSVSPGSAANTAVHIAGVRQRPTTDYTVSGTTLTFAVAPTAGTNNILVVSGTTLSIGTPADGSVSAAKIPDGTIGTAKLGSDITTAGKALLDDANAAAQLTTLGGSAVGKAVFTASDALSARTAAGVGRPDLFARHSVSYGMYGGSAVAGTLTQLPINSLEFNNIPGASLASNQVTLPAGTYYVKWMRCFNRTNATKTALYNATDATYIYSGRAAYFGNSSYVGGEIGGEAYFTISGTKAIELRYIAGIAQATDGLGFPAGGASTSEVYGTVEIWKVA